MTLPILDFLVERMEEFDPDFEHRVGTAFSELFMQPLSLILQPLRDEANEIQLNQSMKRILELDEPNTHPEDAVDELVENFFVFRREGANSGGTVRVFYTATKDINFLEGSLTFTSSGGETFLNVAPVTLTSQEMSQQLEDEFFFVDIVVEAETEGEVSDVEANEIISVSDEDAVRVTNALKFTGGADRETNIELINRARESIGVRDMNTGKGFNAIMFENFINQLVEVQPIGFQDPEMMRDIVFNYHIGGRIDGWSKTSEIQPGTFKAFGLTIDPTRRLNTRTNIILDGTSNVSVGVQNLDNSETNVEVFNIDRAEKAAVFYSYVDLTTGVDLSVNQFIRVAIDDKDPTNVKISGTTPATTQAGEIVNRINVAVGQDIATIAVNPVVISRRRTGFVPAAGTTFYDPTANIFQNLVAGDTLVITLGINEETYLIDSVVSDNHIEVDGGLPFIGNEEEVNYRVNRTGKYVKLLSQTKSIDSSVFIGSPTTGTDALQDAIGLTSQPSLYEFVGSGRFAYVEGVDFSVDLLFGTITRIIGATIVSDQVTGEVNEDIFFEDPSTNIFLNVVADDIITIITATNPLIQKDYRVLEKITNNRLRIDSVINEVEAGVTYRITRTGIKDDDLVLATFDYNPMTIDIGDKIQLDDLGRDLGVRPGREDLTITDMAFLYIDSIEIIDPVSGDSIGEFLDGRGGFGQGGFGKGGFGVGNKSEYFLHVNKPTRRFSALEDSFIVITTAFLGQSFQVNFQYVPEIVTFDTFARSDSERVLDADVLMKHFIPAVVDIKATYTTDPSDANTPTVADITGVVKDFINETRAGQQLDASDIVDVIYEQIDPGRNRNAKVQAPLNMTATIHNTDGTKTIISSSDTLQIPEEDIPAFTTRPLSPRTAHWIAGNIELTAITLSSTGVL